MRLLQMISSRRSGKPGHQRNKTHPLGVEAVAYEKPD